MGRECGRVGEEVCRVRVQNRGQIQILGEL